MATRRRERRPRRGKERVGRTSVRKAERKAGKKAGRKSGRKAGRKAGGGQEEGRGDTHDGHTVQYHVMSALSEGVRVPPSVQGSRLDSPRLIPASQGWSRLISRANLENWFLAPSSHAISFGFHASRATRHRPRHRQRPSLAAAAAVSSLTAATQPPQFVDRGAAFSSTTHCPHVLPAFFSEVRTEIVPYSPETGSASVQRYLSGQALWSHHPSLFNFIVSFPSFRFIISFLRFSRTSLLERAV